MKTSRCNFCMVSILLLSLFFSLSCSNDTDLLADAVLSDSLQEETTVVNDYFVVPTNESVILNVLSNDGFAQNENVHITEISSPTYGSVEINEDNISITYTPQDLSEENQEVEDPTDDEALDNEEVTNVEEGSQTEETTETTDTFTYTAEVIYEDDTTVTAVGTVEVVLDSLNEDESVPEGEDGTTSPDDESSEEQVETTTENTENQTANLLFSSGFEGVTLSNLTYDYRYIEGTDANTGFSWPPKILGSTGTEQEPSGIHTISNGSSSTITNRLETVVGHNGNQTTALFQGIDGTASGTQTPYQINNIKENPDELYITYWMKIDDTSLSGAQKWRALWEYKTEEYGSGGGFRMIAFIYTDNNGRAYWNFQGDRNPSSPVWEKSNFDIPVPRDEWFKVEYFFKWSEGADGRAFMKVNGQLVGEHQGATTANSKDLDFMILTQVYGNTSPMHQWVDDIEIWDGLPNP